MRLIIVYGSPASGKTTYIQEKWRDGDIVIDFDQIYNVLCGTFYGRPTDTISFMANVRAKIIQEADRHESDGIAWIPLCSEVLMIRYKELYGCEVRKLYPGINKCLVNITKDKIRKNDYKSWERRIISWHKNNLK